MSTRRDHASRAREGRKGRWCRREGGKENRDFISLEGKGKKRLALSYYEDRTLLKGKGGDHLLEKIQSLYAPGGKVLLILYFSWVGGNHTRLPFEKGQLQLLYEKKEKEGR